MCCQNCGAKQRNSAHVDVADMQIYNFCSPQSSKYASKTSLKVSQRQCYLEMKDARISVVKLLVVGDDVGQGVLLEGQGCNCCQKPAVTW